MANRAWVRILMAVLLLAGALVTALPDLGQAEESVSMTEPGQQTTLLGPFSLKAGFKTWYAQWQTRTIVGDLQGSNQITSIFAPMIGPQITLSYNREGKGDWFRGLDVAYQYLNAGFGMHQFGAPSANALDSALRTDTTVTASISVYKTYGVYAGYYQSLQRFNFATGGNPALLFKGPITGLFGSQPVSGTRASLYGNVGVGFLTAHPANTATNNSFRTDSVMAYSAETGVNYRLPEFLMIRPSLQIGFRAQVLQQTFGTSGCTPTACAQNMKTNDIMWGPTVMLAATF